MALLDSRAGALTFIVALAPSLVLLCCPSVFAFPCDLAANKIRASLIAKKSRSLVPINLCNQLRCPAVDVHDSRALLSLRLGPVPVAPPKILRVLACDDAIEVASPVLAQAEALDIGTLIECARTKNQEHLLAISRRKTLPENLTEVLVVATSRSC